MKFATLKTDSRDGALLVVSRDLGKCVAVPEVASTLRKAIEDWDRIAPALNAVYEKLNAGAIAAARPFDPRACHSPLPRAWQFLDGSAYLNHVELVRRSRGATVPESFYTDPLMYQGGSDSFIGPFDLVRADEAWGIDFEGEIVVVTGDVPLGASTSECERSIRLVMLMNDVSLRYLLRDEIAKGLGLIQSKPASSFAPVAITPDELGSAWRDSRMHLPVRVQLNGRPFGCPNAGEGMHFNFAQLIAHAARTRDLEAGSLFGGGTVSNKQDKLWGSKIENGGVGYCCIAEVRMYEEIEGGKPVTAYMREGDSVRLDVLDAQGRSVFGAIENKVKALSART